MNIEIRHAEPDDYQAVQQIYNQPNAYSGTLQLPFPSAELWKKRFANKPDDGFQLVACVAGELVGNLGLFIVSQPLRRRHVAYLGMAVHDHWQGKGIGRALLQAAIELADNWLNIVRLELTVYTDNNAAIALYKKFGFKIEGTLEKYAFRAGTYVDAYSMARLRLSATAAGA